MFDRCCFKVCIPLIFLLFAANSSFGEELKQRQLAKAHVIVMLKSNKDGIFQIGDVIRGNVPSDLNDSLVRLAKSGYRAKPHSKYLYFLNDDGVFDAADRLDVGVLMRVRFDTYVLWNGERVPWKSFIGIKKPNEKAAK